MNPMTTRRLTARAPFQRHNIHVDLFRARDWWEAFCGGRYEKVDAFKTGHVYTMHDSVQFAFGWTPILLARPCWSILYDHIVDYEKATIGIPERGVIVTGNPGIGKSMMLNYIAMRRQMDGHSVIVRDNPSNTRVELLPSGEVKPYCSIVPGACTWQLIDTEAGTSNVVHDRNPFTVVASSPDPDNVKQFRKSTVRLYMPMWEKKELSELKDHMNLPRLEGIE
eukprot:TRINITY_DN1962_c0_g1_i1.p2 TRINITY_DN1962_c0_g1~~TRINITY_DN1962_c0_g1_i1.p2  ORF type:complete len:223 (-),score=36.26 TRINITY_DN1962_c0_g1_i1:2986-3654(-)